METVLKTEELTKVYKGKVCLDHVSIEVGKGDIYGLIGKNGAGKTTFMKASLHMVFPTSGKCFLFGSEAPKQRKRVGALIENPTLIKNVSARRNMEYFSLLYGNGQIDVQEMESLLDYVGLLETGKKKVKEFSLGMRQRLGIAVAMLGNPELIILDEPINGLDPSGIKEIRDLIIRCNRERGISFLISSHLLDELGKIATKYGILDRGALLEEISKEELERRCGYRIIIEADNLEKTERILRGLLPEDAIAIEKGRVIINENIERIAEFNRKLVENDVSVTMLCKQSQSLEQYFMERVGD